MRTIAVTLVLSASLAGCSGDSGPPSATVSGVVKYKGEPVKHANVMFFPKGVEGGRTAHAMTDAEGRFSQDSVAVGSNFVTVTEGWPPGAAIPTDDMGMEKSPPRGPWDNKYRDSTNPRIRVEVAAGRDNTFEWDLTE